MKDLDIEYLKFLIIDDNRHMRTLIKTILAAFRCKDVVEASDGAEAFKVMRTGPSVDIILLDWQMKPLDGVEFTRVIRTGADSPNPFVPIIMISGHSERQRIIHARDAGVNEFLCKPISARILYSRIEAVVMKPRPFVRTKSFFGPDRRRRAMSFDGDDRRQGIPGAGDDRSDRPTLPADGKFDQDDINKFFNPT